MLRLGYSRYVKRGRKYILRADKQCHLFATYNNRMFRVSSTTVQFNGAASMIAAPGYPLPSLNGSHGLNLVTVYYCIEHVMANIKVALRTSCRPNAIAKGLYIQLIRQDNGQFMPFPAFLFVPIALPQDSTVARIATSNLSLRLLPGPPSSSIGNPAPSLP